MLKIVNLSPLLLFLAFLTSLELFSDGGFVLKKAEYNQVLSEPFQGAVIVFDNNKVNRIVQPSVDLFELKTIVSLAVSELGSEWELEIKGQRRPKAFANRNSLDL